MKKQILILSTTLASLLLMAFGFITLENPAMKTTGETQSESHCKPPQPEADKYPDFFYDFGTRFGAIKKSDLDKMTHASDFLVIDEDEEFSDYGSVSVIIVIDDKRSDIREVGTSNELTAGQINLLRSSEPSTNFVVSADFECKNNKTGVVDYKSATPHLTIVPEKQAEYLLGKKALLAFFRENNKENTADLDEDKLQPAKLYFTVSKNGSITNVHLDRTSGFDHIDKTMVDLVNRLPSSWIPAENIQGEKVDQELVVSFGMVGC